MAKQDRKNTTVSLWRFRREINLGTLMHLATILIFLSAGWTNLQNQLVLIRHSLDELITAQRQLQGAIKQITTRQQQQEIRQQKLQYCQQNQQYKMEVLRDRIDKIDRRMSNEKNKSNYQSNYQQSHDNPTAGDGGDGSGDTAYIGVRMRQPAFCPR